MKKALCAILALVLLLSLCACSKKETTSTWQEQYDLGMRYLSESEYEQAILAFTAAIEIDPKQADAYLALAKVYVEQGAPEKAAEILDKAIAEIGETDELVEAKAALDAHTPEPTPAPVPTPGPTVEPEITPEPETTPEPTPESTPESIPSPEVTPGSTPEPTPVPTPEPTPEVTGPRTERREKSDGSYWLVEYDSSGKLVKHTRYYPGDTLESVCEYVNEKLAKTTYYDADGTMYRVEEYLASDNLIVDTMYFPNGTISSVTQYNTNIYMARNMVKRTTYYENGVVAQEAEYDGHGNAVKVTGYNEDGTVRYIKEY